MKTSKPSKQNVIKWAARVWSLLIFIFAVVRIFTPDPYATDAVVPLEDWFLLSLWGIAILGLLIAWRWEVLGAGITIGVMFMREIVWIILKGSWLVNFLLIWVVLVPPAILFLISARMEGTPEQTAA